MIQTSGSPVQTLDLVAFGIKPTIKLSVLREDLNHPIIEGGKHINGNKWRKLQYNIQHVLENQLKGILTFGGAFSNHLYAVAAAGSAFGFHTIGIVRGKEWQEKNNATLQFCQQQGMQLVYWDRTTYRQKDTLNSQLQKQYPDYWIVPEGGTNDLAIKGVSEMAIPNLDTFTEVTVPIGTGGTLAGLILAAKNRSYIAGYSALKIDFQPTIENLLGKSIHTHINWSVNHNYHFGGYAKYNEDLLAFIRKFKTIYDIQLEPLYTGKMMYGIVEQIKNEMFEQGSHILAIHTGGLQSLAGFEKRFEIKL